MFAHDREDAVVTAQEIQRVIAARRQLRRADRRDAGGRRPRHGIVAPVLDQAEHVTPLLREHDHRIARD
ncbi:hypothetical protein [Patulibacter sp. SYSU D01012]|uniref:hypothetical protein n=1 Tax=Patulibacter sp. SYSU D01012 TaxID=2817381 RepID=UPI001B315184|nr:hypothetical protein [Patulibacter sp. SYSU D01012]